MLRRAVSLRPDDAALHQRLGALLLRAGRPEQAAESLRTAIALNPRLAATHHALGVALHALGATDEAIAAYRRAVELSPRLADAQSRLGNLLHAIGDQVGAQRAFEQAAAAARGTTLGRTNHAKALMLAQRPEEAEQALRQAAALDPSAAEVRRLLGTLLAEAGRFDAAVAMFEASLAIDPTQVAIYHDLVHCKKITDADSELIAHMLARLNQPLSEVQRLRLNFALGKCFDDRRDYATAIQHFDAANQIKQRLARFDRTALQRTIDAIIGCFTPELVASHAGRGSADPKPLLVIGMPRSGTTLVEQILSSHPEVGAAGELDFWGRHGDAWLASGELSLPAEYMAGLAEQYLAVLSRAAPGKARVVDKMPFNFLWAGLIHLAFPQATFVHCRRHPIDTCLSIYFTNFSQRTEFSARREDLVFYFRQYERLMAHWRAVLPSERLVEIEYQSLVTEQEQSARDLLSATGLSWDDSCLRPESNQRSVRTATVWQARQPIYASSLERWRRYEPWLGVLRELEA